MYNKHHLYELVKIILAKLHCFRGSIFKCLWSVISTYCLVTFLFHYCYNLLMVMGTIILLDWNGMEEFNTVQVCFMRCGNEDSGGRYYFLSNGI